MRRTTALMIAASMLAAPAYAQDNAVGNDISAADAGTPANVDAPLADDANGIVAGPVAAPVTTDTALPPAGEAVPDDDDEQRFPWGLLGLLGLVGLLGKRRRDTDLDDRTAR